MSVFQDDCPHCGTKSVAFTILNEKLWNEEYNFYQWDTFAICGHCKRGVVATFQTPGSATLTKYLEGSQRRSPYLQKIAPALPATGAPAHTPTNVARFFEQAMDNLPNNWVPPAACSARRWIPA